MKKAIVDIPNQVRLTIYVTENEGGATELHVDGMQLNADGQPCDDAWHWQTRAELREITSVAQLQEVPA